MFLIRKNKNTLPPKQHLEKLFHHYLIAQPDWPDHPKVDLLVEIVRVFRDNRSEGLYDVDLSPLVSLLNENQLFRIQFTDYLKQLLLNKAFHQLISDSAIINYTDLRSEVRKRLMEKILPYQPAQSSVEYVLNQVFYSNHDILWINRISIAQMRNLFELCNFESFYEEHQANTTLMEILYGLEILVQRISGKAVESEVSKMVPELQNFDSPFSEILREFAVLHRDLISAPQKYLSSDHLAYKQILILHKQCEDYITTAFQNAHQYGISIQVNLSLLQIKQQLRRIREIIPFLIKEQGDDQIDKTIAFGLKLIEYNNSKTNVRKLLNESTQILAYEVTQHTAISGEHYITSTKKEYWNMFWSACGGALIVAVLCVIKVLLGKVHTSIFMHAVLYSLNYSIGFIAIYLCGFTLATKQPAMTASAFVNALAHGTSEQTGFYQRYWTFAHFFARLFRSQFIAFVGNVIIAFPAALFLIWSIDHFFGYNIAHDKWFTLINDLNPMATLAVFHAAIAGVFLFLSGIIAGSISNRDKHHEVYYRIQEHPLLKRLFGKKKTRKISSWYEKKWAGLISNLWFGVFMGSTASVGIFLGLNLDIRHITFASGNLALGIYGGEYKIPESMLVWGILGIGIIGFVNFMVSFSLSLILAFSARKMSIFELRLVAKAIWKLFTKRPLLFFFPPGRPEA